MKLAINDKETYRYFFYSTIFYLRALFYDEENQKRLFCKIMRENF